jgi:hypothetical protein
MPWRRPSQSRRPSAQARRGSSRRPSRTRQRATSSGSRRSSAGASTSSSGGASRFSPTPVLTDAGYPPELAYFEVCNELKLIVDLIYKSGISGMYRAVSDTAKYGGMAIGPMIIDDHVEDNMRKALYAIQDGSFARQWIEEAEAGLEEFDRLMLECESLEVEKVGKEVRRMSGLEE